VTFRLQGTTKDLIVVGSDSGRIVLLEFDDLTSQFNRIHSETYGKSGVRRVIPGQFLAVDPKGRAVMIAAVEKQKFVYLLNRDHANRLTITSPLEAHKSNTLVFAVAGVDVGYENPVFAVIEIEAGDFHDENSASTTGAPQKLLVFYEMDLGLNHVIRKAAQPLPVSAHALVSIPGGADGPSGVIVCCEDCILYRSLQGVEVKSLIPRRADMSQDSGIFFNCHATHRQKNSFFVLFNSEQGDLYRISLAFTPERVSCITVQYFDTIMPCISLCILKTGFLYAAGEIGSQAYYQFTSTGEDDEFSVNDSASESPAIFMPRPLTNLYQLFEFESLSAITDLKVADLTGEGQPQIYSLCGRGSRSMLKVLRHGLSVTQMASTKFPGKPNAVWTLKGEGLYDKYIVMSFLNATVILEIGERMNETTTSPFVTDKSTIHVSRLSTGAYIQVISTALFHVTAEGTPSRWSAPGKVSHACSNERQVVVALQGGILIYFEIDSSGRLNEIEKKEMEQEVICIDLPAVPEGRMRTRFLAVGCYDNTVKILSLDPENCLGRLSTQALPGCQPESVCLLELSVGGEKETFLHVGLANGVLLRTVVDGITGQLSDSRARFLGSRPVRLCRLKMQGEAALCGLSSRTWLSYDYMSKHYITPISYETLDHAASFSSAKCPEGVVAIVEQTLRIFIVERPGELFNSSVLPLRYTPRRCEVNPTDNSLIICESDHNTFNAEDLAQLRKAAGWERGDLTDAQIGVPKAGEGRWGTCIRVVDPVNLQTKQLWELLDNETIVSCCLTTFAGHEANMFLVLGIVNDMYLHPRTFSSATIVVLSVSGSFAEVHRTPVEDIPLALCPFFGKILVGVGNKLRLYELGRQKLLKKGEDKITFPLLISQIKVDGERIFACDISESFTVLRWHMEDQQFLPIADDVAPRWITASCLLDHDTLAATDKFENFFVLRIPPQCDDEEEMAPSMRHKWEAGYLGGAFYKLDLICQYFLGDLATSLTKAKLSDGSAEVLVYGTSMGAIGILLPLTRKEDVEFFVHLEMYLRSEIIPLCGREHLAYRSSYAPVKNVVDGDLCEFYPKLDIVKQRALAEEIMYSPAEVHKRLEDIRNLVI